MKRGEIRVGIGGWTYEPWRGTFYPPGLRHADELEYAARHVTVIEINATYYRLQKPDSFRKWAAAVPADFVFAVKASRYCTNRTVLADAGDAVERFLGQGLTQLGARLGPILWQFMPTKVYDREDFAAFLRLLPDAVGGLKLRHALEVRHESFMDDEFPELARERGAAVVFTDSEDYPCIDARTADFTYARLQRASEAEAAGYAAAELDAWAAAARAWSKTGDAFVFMINGAKVRAPGAAMALIERLGAEETG